MCLCTGPLVLHDKIRSLLKQQEIVIGSESYRRVEHFVEMQFGIQERIQERIPDFNQQREMDTIIIAKHSGKYESESP